MVMLNGFTVLNAELFLILYNKKNRIMGINKQPIKWFLPMFFNGATIPRLVAITKTRKPKKPDNTMTKRVIMLIIVMHNFL